MDDLNKLLQQFNELLPEFYKFLWDKRTTKKDLARALQAVMLHPYAHQKVEFTGKNDKKLYDACLELDKKKLQANLILLRAELAQKREMLEKK
jgi:hypothetical protein